MINSHEIDAAFVHRTCEDPNLQFTPFVTDQMVIVTSERHPFADRKSINIKELEYEKFIVPPPTSGYNQTFRKPAGLQNLNPRLF